MERHSDECARMRFVFNIPALQHLSCTHVDVQIKQVVQIYHMYHSALSSIVLEIRNDVQA